jgi:hypothetical protein
MAVFLLLRTATHSRSIAEDEQRQAMAIKKTPDKTGVFCH